MSKLTVQHQGLDTTARDGRVEVDAEARPADDRPPVGSWFWVKDDDKKKPPYLRCVTHVGSNYVEVEFPDHGSYRIHLDEFWERCTPEPNPEKVINENVEHYRGEVRRLMGEVHEITARLGVGVRQSLSNGNETQALVTHSKGAVEDYQKALVKAKEKQLPELFSEIKKNNERMARWMTASMTPLKAQADALGESLELIENRIFAVELYAGLTENVELIRKGKPAGETEPIHLLQRRCYMDEECLAKYEAGGMRLANLGAFDEWLSRPENLNRLLPFKRCVVAFRVRRHHSHAGEEDAFTLSDFINIQTGHEEDKMTFLYIRNGERVYRLNTKIEFDAKLFPDLDRQMLTQKLWAKMFASSIDGLITDGDYQEMVRENAEAKAKWDAMSKKERKEKHNDWFHAPHSDIEYHRYQPYEPDNVYHDDITKYIADEMAKHNRLVLVLQGLLDRSPVFHPHPPWQIFTAEGFATGIKLIFDEDRALVAGEAPDFEAYRARLNSILRNGSVTVGQDDAWELAEGKKETDRRQRDWRHTRDRWYPTRFRPYGDPGPGKVAKVEHFSKKNQTCTYRWTRERRVYNRYNVDERIPASFTAPVSKLLNIDAYTPGDFHQFFDDPRTRADYIQWAPLLLVAEDFKAGKIKVKVAGKSRLETGAEETSDAPEETED